MASMIFPGGIPSNERLMKKANDKADYYKKKLKKLKKENKLLREQINLLRATNTKSKSI